MTADFSHLPYEFLGEISSEIINRVKGVNRVVYDISSKPPLHDRNGNSPLIFNFYQLVITLKVSLILNLIKQGLLKILYTILFLFIGYAALTQDFQQKYLTGKALFRDGKYRLAMEAFRSVADPTTKSTLTEYASYYFALSAYHDGQIYVARDMLLQIADRFYTWRKMDEVNLWLTQVNFELKNYTRALKYFDDIVSDEILRHARPLMRYQLSQIDSLEVLLKLHSDYPDDRYIGEALVTAITEQPLATKDFGLMESLVNKFELNRSRYNVLDYSQNVKKESYQIGVLLPFMFESFDQTRQILRNNLVTSLYEGMLLAEEELRDLGKQIELIPYDTKRSEGKTVSIIRQEELRSMDLIVGPLYPGPSRIVSQFSYDNRINMVNPLSSNSEVIGNNPYSFLFEPSSETQAKIAAQFAAENFEKGTAVILYEDNVRDSIFAHVYKAEIEKDSFEVVWFRKFTEENTREIIDTLTATFESDIPEELVDSLLEIEDYPMELKRKEEPDDPDEYYEELLVIPPDSIGHILTSSNKVVFAANSISVVNVRGDSIPLIGREEWLNHASIGFDQLEQLDVSLIAPTYYDEGTGAYDRLKNKILRKYQSAINQYHVIGYELIHYFGWAVHNYGKYFQTGIRESDIRPGQILQGVRYGFSNDNQVVPIIKFRDSQLERVNNR